MIKAKGTLHDGSPVYLFGLSARNVELLRQGKPMFIKLADMGERGEVVICYGETEAELARKLADLIGPQTQVSGMDVVSS